jgi:hypothetical protein
MNQIIEQLKEAIENHWAESLLTAVFIPVVLVVSRRVWNFIRSFILNEDKMEYAHRLEEDKLKHTTYLDFYDKNGKLHEILCGVNPIVKAYKPRSKDLLTIEQGYEISIQVVNELKRLTSPTKRLPLALSDFSIDDPMSKNKKCRITTFAYRGDEDNPFAAFIEIQYFKNWFCKFIAFLINYKIKPYQLVMVDEAD